MPPFLRSYQLWILIQKYHQDVIEYDDEFVKFRLRLILSFFQSVIDFLCMPFFIPVAISPVGRQVCVHTLYNHLLPIHNDFEPYSKSMSSLRWIIVQNGVGSIIDILCMFSILLVILVPSLWYGFFVGCNELFHSYPTGSEKEFESWYTQFRLHCIHQVSHSITDFSCLLFLLMAILSPLRNTSTRTGLSALKSDINYCVGDFEYGYNFAMRKLVFKMGFLALSDMFLLPLLLPLFLTRYRYLAIANDLYSSSLWGFKEFFLISSQTCLLFADIFILGSTLPFLYLTRIRWQPVAGVLLEENVFVDKSAKLYRTAMFQISRLLLDLILCPLALIGLLSHRRQFIVKVWSDPIKWEDGFTFHYEILVNFMIVFHDVFILSIAVIILSVLCPYRVPIIYHIVSTNWAADNVSLTNHEESLRVQAVRNAKFRFEIWHQFFFGIIDIPFNICALLLLLTGWRTRELLMKVFHEWGSIKGEKSWYRFVTEADGRIRICVVEELFNFIRDFLCLIPFAVLVVTMYRLPEVLLTLYSKLSSKSLQSEPLFDVSACECDFPDVGSPKLNFKIHARKIIDVEAHSVSIDKSTNASLHVISPSLWPAVAVTFGSVVASAARTMLPLKLKDKETIGITDFEELSGVEPSQTLWVKIETGRLKKSTMLRKINRLPPETKLMVQLEGGCSTHNGGPITKEVLFRFLISLGNIAS